LRSTCWARRFQKPIATRATLFRTGKKLVYFLVIIVDHLLEIVTAFLVGRDPIVDRFLAFLGQPGGLIQERTDNFFVMFVNHGHGTEAIVKGRFVELNHLQCDFFLVHLSFLHLNNWFWPAGAIRTRLKAKAAGARQPTLGSARVPVDMHRL
jgi:hypothetical protein